MQTELDKPSLITINTYTIHDTVAWWTFELHAMRYFFLVCLIHTMIVMTNILRWKKDKINYKYFYNLLKTLIWLDRLLTTEIYIYMDKYDVSMPQYILLPFLSVIAINTDML